MIFQTLCGLPRPLYFLFAGTVITRMGSFVFPYLTIYLSEERGYGYEMVGAVLSIGSLGLLAGNFAGGVLTDRWSRKLTLIAALLLNAFGFAGLAFHYFTPWLYALFLFGGYVGTGMFGPAANTMIADIAPSETRPFAYTVNYICVNLGMGLGPLLGGFLATISFKWIFIGDVVSSLACTALLGFGVADTFRQRVTSEHRSRDASQTSQTSQRMTWSIWRQNQTVVLFCLLYFFLIGPLMGMEFAVPLLIKKEFATSLIYIGFIYSINAACILAFSFLIEKWIRHRDEILMMVLSGVIWSLGMSVLFFGYSIASLMICTAIWTIGEIIASILVPNFIAGRVPTEFKGRFMALNDIVRSFAGVILPIGLGFLWAYYSASIVVLTITLLPIVGTICYAILFATTKWQASKVGTALNAQAMQMSTDGEAGVNGP